MDVTGKHFNEPILRGWLLKLMKAGQDYTLPELIDLVIPAHQKAGGLQPTIPEELLEQRFHAALNDIVDEGWVGANAGFVGEGMDGERVVVEESWISFMGAPEHEDLPSLPEKKAKKEAEAEITMGEGEYAVYGWYLPAYKELADLKGEERFPVKVGRTTKAVPYHRLTAHLGTAPEKPKLGFLWRTDNAELWEKVLHIRLRQRGQHMTDALGNEWFRTTPRELREIVRGLARAERGLWEGLDAAP